MKAKAILSATISFFFALITYFILLFLLPQDALLISVLVGLSYYIMLLVAFIISGKIMDKKYTEFEKQITSPVFCKTNGNFNLGNGKIKNGNIYFCEAGIVCVSLDKKPYTLDEISLQNIEQYYFDDIHLNILTTDGRLFAITIPDIKNVINILKEKEWINF